MKPGSSLRNSSESSTVTFLFPNFTTQINCMVSLIRIILIAALIYFGIRFIDRFIIPYFFSNTKKDKKDDTTVSGTGKRRKYFDNNDGDYIDYEEVD